MRRLLALPLALVLMLPLTAHAQAIHNSVLTTTINLTTQGSLIASVNTGALAAGTWVIWASGHVYGSVGDEIECQLRTALGAGGFTGSADNRVIPGSGETALTLVPVPVSPLVATTYTLYCMDETSTGGIIEPVDTYIAWAGPF